MKYEIRKIEEGINILKSGRTPDYAEKESGVPASVLIKCYFRKDKIIEEMCDPRKSLTKSTSYWDTEEDVLESIQLPSYKYEDISKEEKKSYISNDKKTWIDENYTKYILKI